MGSQRAERHLRIKNPTPTNSFGEKGLRVGYTLSFDSLMAELMEGCCSIVSGITISGAVYVSSSSSNFDQMILI